MDFACWRRRRPENFREYKCWVMDFTVCWRRRRPENFGSEWWILLVVAPKAARKFSWIQVLSNGFYGCWRRRRPEICVGCLFLLSWYHSRVFSIFVLGRETPENEWNEGRVRWARSAQKKIGFLNFQTCQKTNKNTEFLCSLVFFTLYGFTLIHPPHGW